LQLKDRLFNAGLATSYEDKVWGVFAADNLLLLHLRHCHETVVTLWNYHEKRRETCAASRRFFQAVLTTDSNH